MHLDQVTKSLNASHIQSDNSNIFTEVNNKGHKDEPPEHLQ